MQQVVIIGGGEVFHHEVDYLKFLKSIEISLWPKRNDWKANLQKDLGTWYHVISPSMPNKLNASYVAWSILFRKYIEKLQGEKLLTPDGVVLIGHSLGGLFLARYIEDRGLSGLKIKGLFLISAPYADQDVFGELWNFALSENEPPISEIAQKIFVYHSEDDKIVPWECSIAWQIRYPTAKLRKYKKQGHFLCEHIPQLLKDIRAL